MIPFSSRLQLSTFFKKSKGYWETNDKEHQFYLSRSSWSILAICLLKKANNENKKINLFLPEYFCNDPIPILDYSFININYYEINDDFKPNLNSLNESAENIKPDILLTVHYFGKPSYSNELRSFCIKYKSWYIEDATHCLKKDSIIGKQGDFVLFSLYKHLSIPDGAILLVRSNGPSNLCLDELKKININNFLKKELIVLKTQKSIIKNNSNLKSIIWLLKQTISFLFKNTSILKNYYTKNYANNYKPKYRFQTYSYKISFLSYWLHDKFDLDYISKIKFRNQSIFKILLKNSINIPVDFDLRLNYRFHTPYIVPFKLINNIKLKSLINFGYPIIKWPLFPDSNYHTEKCVKEKFDNYYFLIIHESINSSNFKKLIDLSYDNRKIEFKKNKIDINNWNIIASKSKNFNILQSWNYGIAKSVIEKKQIEHYEILIDQNKVGCFQVLSKNFFGILTVKRINRGPVLVDDLSYENRIEILKKILKIGSIFKGKLLAISPEISFFSIESIFFNSKRIFKLPIPNWKSSMISLANDTDYIFSKLKPKWRNSLKFSQKHNLRVNIFPTKKNIEEVLIKYNELTKKKNFNGINPDLIKEISLSKNKNEELFTIEAIKDSDKIGFIIVSIQSQNSIYLIGWTDDTGRKLNVNNLLLWNAIVFLKQKQINNFDLGGLIGNSHSIDLFKLGLNGKYYENLGEFIRF